MLSIENIVKTYRGPGERVQAVRDVSLTVDAGEFVTVRGPSGCGKSTLLLAAGGLLEPESGRVTVDGQDIYALGSDDRAKIRACNIGFVFQQFHLVPYLNVRENVLAAAMAAGKTDRAQRADELLERFGMTHRASHVPSALSTGERQRTAMARALLNKPKLLLADEPTGNLDAENAEVVLGHMKTFASEGGAVLLVTHDVKAERYADRSIEIEDGSLTAR
jgi:ABC-type lipoprotein export system ATPase subunit